MVSAAAQQNLRNHLAAEAAGDLEGTMAALSDSPVWLIPGYRLEGREAVRALYETTLPLMPPQLLEEMHRAIDDPSVISWGESHCVIEYSDAYPMRRGWVLVVHFDGDLIAGEHGYLTQQTETAPGLFGEDFDRIPGVTRLS